MLRYHAWESFPSTYRAAEIALLAQRLSLGVSCSVVGSSGCGRSSLLHFLYHWPEAFNSHLSSDSDPVVLILVDFNNFPANDLSTLYRVILRSCHWACERFEPDISLAIANLYHEIKTAQDPFLAQSALYELLFECRARRIRVALIFDHFDRFCQAATLQMLNTLRGLRDSFRETLCFIVGMSHTVAYLPNPDILGDMYELLDTYVCWVGAMSDTDARHVIISRTAPATPTENEIHEIITLTGSFSVLLKAISYWWRDGGRQLPITDWLTVLAADHSFEYRLAQLWNGLTQEEQFVCMTVYEEQARAAGTGETKSARQKALEMLEHEHGSILSLLKVKGMCQKTKAGWEIRSKLMADYIKRAGPISRGKIRIDEKTGDIYQGATMLCQLSPLEEKLLRLMIRQPYMRHEANDLIAEIFSQDAIDDQGKPYSPRDLSALHHLVYSLRGKIEVRRSVPCYLITPQAGYYQFFPEGRPAYRPE
jgi:hypothetical protein